jgi:DNA-binding CsgD family transcriptional regulator
MANMAVLRPRERTIQWRTLAAEIAASSETPLCVLDHEGRIALHNEAFRARLGTPGQAPPDEAFWEHIASGGWAASDDCRACLHDALDGVKRRCALRRGPEVVHLELAPVGEGGAVLVTVPAAPQCEESLVYEIDTTPERFGAVLQIWPGTRPVTATPGEPCHRALRDAGEPCPGCPAQRVGPGRELARAFIRRPGPSLRFDQVVARRIAPGRVRVRVRDLDEADQGQLLRARIEAIAADARLSERERHVLDAVVRGHDNRAIAADLGIAERTVKFHQTNMLQKLGLDSRADLIRLLVGTSVALVPDDGPETT